MSTMLQQLTTEVSKHVIAQITNKLLPAISEKYNISLDELMDLVNGSDVNNSQQKPKTVIKATPKKSSTPANEDVTESTSSVKPKSVKASPKASITKSLVELQKKIAAAQAAGKVLNVSSGRPLADTMSNRKKFKFYDELGIAGVAGDEKLTDVLKLFGPPPKKEIPVHEQAAKAKARAKAVTKSVDSEEEHSIKLDDDDEEESENVTVPSKKPQPVEDEESEDGPVPSKKPQPVEDEESENVPVQPKKQQPVKKDDQDESPAPKATFSVKRTVTKTKPEPVKPAKVEVKEPEPLDEEDDEPEQENVDTIVKLSNLIEETNTKVDEEENEEPEQGSVKPKTLVSRYNPKLKQWWNPDTAFILKRKGIKSFVTGKLVDEKIVPLTDNDLKTCKKNGWEVDTSVLKVDDKSGSQSGDEDSD